MPRSVHTLHVAICCLAQSAADLFSEMRVRVNRGSKTERERETGEKGEKGERLSLNERSAARRSLMMSHVYITSP